MKATVSVLLALLLLASPLAAIAAAQEDEVEIQRDLQVEVKTGSTERFGGGDWIRIDVGSTTFAVLYGNETNPNFPKIVAEYDRYLGAAEIYNESEELLKTMPIPVRTIMIQSFEMMVEFKDGNDDGLMHFPRSLSPIDLLSDSIDLPRKLLVLRQSWSLEDLVITEDENVTAVDFNITATNLDYTLVGPFDDPGDGLDRITFSFHIRVELVETTLDVPVYKIVVAEDRGIISSDVNRTETLTGMTVNGTFKYDHYIEGWDWGGDDSRLALSTHLIVGTHVPPPVWKWLHLQFDPHARDEGGVDYHNESLGESPTLITADKMVFEDDWERIGRIRWVSGVEVDGVMQEMYFQLHRVERLLGFERLFAGVLFGGAFIYPQGNVIFHDPTLDASVFVPGGQIISEVLPGLAPYFIQAVVAGLVVVGLVLFRTFRGRSGS
ncbi:MAG: hypothetical protein V3U52_08010 [Thermoplasmata archaeon]